MNSNKKVHPSYKLKLTFLSILCMLFLSFSLLLTSCGQDPSLQKIDVGSQDGTSAPQPAPSGQENEPESEEFNRETQENGNNGSEDENNGLEDEVTEEGLTDGDEAKHEEKEAPQPLTTNVYYADSQVQYLVGEERIISASHKYLSAFLELLKPPLEPGHMMLVPENTRVNRISFENGNIELDLSKEFVDERFISNAVDVLLVYSIVNTMTEFDEVNTVTFFVEGQRLDLLGQLDISSPLYRDKSWIKE